MHKYLKSIGFGEYTNSKQIRNLKKEVMESASRKEIYDLENGEYIFCYEKDYGECFGLCLIKIGESEADSEIDSFYPYLRGFHYLYNGKIDIEACSDQEGFYGCCDDNNIGIPMIFRINDPVRYRKLKDYHSGEYEIDCVTLSGLASDGVVLLPIEKNEYQIKHERQENEIRNDMIDAAKAGNLEAIEKLTIDDMSTYTCVNLRSKREDIFSIVSSYFMPHTVECDKYSILGEITDTVTMKNKVTGETVYYISVDCNSIEFEVMINAKDIMGTPEKGRRFKGHVWMQGQMECI